MDASDAAIRSWSRDKLELLREYLQAYSVIMRRQKETWLRSYSYIDAFAGVGQYMDADSQQYIDGSPLVALRCDPPFDEYRFIEVSRSRLENLRRRVQSEFAERRVLFHQDNANEVLRDQVAHQITYRDHQRGFVFLDPYGLQVDFQTIRRLAESKAFDIFVNFSVMGINRILERTQLPDTHTAGLLTRVMGDADWAADLYVTQRGLFEGEEQTRRARLDPALVADQYLQRIRQLFRFVSEPVLMRNSREAPLYSLFLASHNEAAVRITNDIFRRYRRQRAQPGS